MLHDARNLVGTIGLYCDLLAMPGVLKPEHSKYPEELRHLGARSGALIDALMRSLLMRERSRELCAAAMTAEKDFTANQDQVEVEQTLNSTTPTPISLRGVVERCSGLLRRVADGRVLEVEFGPAAAAPVKVSEEAVERILVNLVKNAASAMDQCGRVDDGPGKSDGSIRIKLGMLASRVGGARPWPFQRVRLSVEDSGCGMSLPQMESLLNGSQPASGSHGIGFRVVREMAEASGGLLQMTSAEQVGTRVQIEWPVAVVCDHAWERTGRMESALGEPLTLSTWRSRRAGDKVPQFQMEGAC